MPMHLGHPRIISHRGGACHKALQILRQPPSKLVYDGFPSGRPAPARQGGSCLLGWVLQAGGLWSPLYPGWDLHCIVQFC